jgi:hypothetical protein
VVVVLRARAHQPCGQGAPGRRVWRWGEPENVTLGVRQARTPPPDGGARRRAMMASCAPYRAASRARK